ncbi:MAG TPA: tetratricopeptide repeat protein [Chitinophaga sp.]|uniref:tetratricopeptide repeat protein n=1 Tax=Chitinophaga sp. TaxID=1869181 RepID=UPI002BA5C77A|nr:tetratricopeptide repeat protein [Chitinophaga sp.]HVI46242.1 tetratricopeptide repeat protein [Chitinophaga sp.]
MLKQLLSHIFVYTLLLVSLQLDAQEQVPLSKRADEHFRRSEYAKAAGLYEKILRTRRGRKQAPFIIDRLATSYRLYNQYEKAAYWYAQALKDSTGASDKRLYYGDMLKSLGRYAEAKQQYQLYPDQRRVAARIAGCDSAAFWQSQPAYALLENVKGVNSRANDWGATWYNKQIVFVSDSLRHDIWYVKGSRRRYGRNNEAYGKLYAAESTASGIGYVKDFSAYINDYPYHVGPVVFSSQEDTAYVTVTNPARKVPYNKRDIPVYGTRHLELLMFVKRNNKWQTPVAFPYNSNDYSTGHAALNPGGNILYFSSDRPGGSGATDIWYSEKQTDNTWGTPQNCGSINTVDEEEFPTVGPDGTLYFSSKGWPGMGGFDIFAANGSRNSWSAPVNLRLPFNAAGDDFYYVVNGEGKGFIASNRTGGKGEDDIYSFAAPQTVPGLTPLPVPLLRIPFTGEICVPVSACVYLYNKTRGMGWCYIVEPPSGRIEAKLEADAEYVIRVHYNNRTDSYEFNTRNITGTDALNKSFCPSDTKKMEPPASPHKEKHPSPHKKSKKRVVHHKKKK